MINEEKKSDLDSFWDDAYSRDAEKELKKQMKLEAKQKKKEAKLKLKGMDETDSEEKTAVIDASADSREEEKTAVVSAEAKPIEEVAAEEGTVKKADDAAASSEIKVNGVPVSAEGEDASSESASDEEEKPKKKKKKKKKKASSEDEDAEDAEDSEEEEESDGKERDPHYNIVKDLGTLIIYIGIVVLICFLIITFVGQRTTVKGDSMLPTLTNKDNLWIDKLSYRFHDPKRFDIVVFPYDDDEFYIKRIIGLPGETVQIKDGAVYINGELLDDPYAIEPMNESGIVSSPVLLREDQYFVLGDNRNRSHDSRYSDVGFIKRSDITGKAVFRLTPFKKFGKVK